MGAPPENLLLKLSAMREEQFASLQSLEHLTQQHRDWHKALDDLLEEVNNLMKSKESLAATDGSSPPTAISVNDDQMQPLAQLTKAQELQEFEENRKETRRSTTSLLRPRAGTAAELSQGPLRKVLMEVMTDNASQEVESDTCWARVKKAAGDIVKSNWFEFIAGGVILLNLISIGIEAELSLTNDLTFYGGFWPGGVERIFLALYCIEALIRLVAGGWSTFKDLWFLLDVVLIFVGLLTLLIMPVIIAETGLSFEKLLVVRGLRLLRLVRALRMISHFKVVWRLVYGLLTAGQTMLSMTMLIGISLFICACVAVELIAKDPDLRTHPTLGILVEENYNGLNRSFLTLLQFVTLDGIANVSYPLMLEKPYLGILFFPILIFISIGLMNLVTAALVENAMETSASEAEEKRRELKEKVKEALPSLIEIFHQLDVDKSGLITHDEVENVPVSILPPRVLDALCVENIADIFDYLDVDGTGELSQMEFVEGLLQLCLLDMPMSAILTLKLLRSVRTGMMDMDAKVNNLTSQVEWIGGQVLDCSAHVEMKGDRKCLPL